jgi:hypothetical protein
MNNWSEGTKSSNHLSGQRSAIPSSESNDAKGSVQGAIFVAEKKSWRSIVIDGLLRRFFWKLKAGHFAIARMKSSTCK